jgi:hypothetical protein
MALARCFPVKPYIYALVYRVFALWWVSGVRAAYHPTDFCRAVSGRLKLTDSAGYDVSRNPTNRAAVPYQCVRFLASFAGGNLTFSSA